LPVSSQHGGSTALGRYLTLPGLRKFALRTRLCMIVAMILAPALILAGMLSLQSMSSDRAHVEEELQRTLRQLEIEINEEIQSTTALLAVIAGSHFLEVDNIEGFQRRAAEISRQLGNQVVVRRPQIDHEIIRIGAPGTETTELTMPAARLEAEQHAIKAGKTVISDVFYGPVGQRFLVAAITPVIRNGSTGYVVSIGMPIQRFSDILQTASPGGGRLAVVIDRNNTIVARSENGKSLGGSKVPSDFADLTAAKAEGVMDHTNREGVVLHWVFRRLPSTGWLVAVGVPTALLNAQARNTLASVVAAASTLFALGIGLTYLLGGRIEEKIGTLGIDRKPTREEFALFFDSAPNGIVLVDNSGLVLLTSAELARMFGYAQKELIGRPVETLIPAELRDAHVGHRHGFAHNRVPRPMGAERNLLGRRKDGSEFPIEVGLFPITVQGIQYTTATVIDITERSLAAKALSTALTERDRLRRNLMRSAEDERLRLSHELHDQTGQMLIAATLAVKDIEKFVGPDGKNTVAELNGLLDQMGRTLHRVAWELRPASIDELGLAAMLDNYVSDWSDQTGIAAEFYSKGEEIDELPDDIRTTLYRVIQEALTNVAKHARGANRVGVAISRTGATLQLTIDDNGIGFDPAEKPGTPRQHGPLGIPSMRERLSMIGGTLEIESGASIGTTVFARIRLEPDEATQ
jgi:two-component system, NarL family, sensor histidine kinase UhpB